jgi:SAM-dependent methyltransferase
LRSAGGGADPGGIPKGAQAWEESYREHEPGWFFGTEPSALARRLVHYFRRMEIPIEGRLLDIGCGEGRDVLFLAGLGFEVDAIDGSPTAVARAQEELERRGSVARIELADLSRMVWRGDYDVIFANNSVQFAGGDALRVLEEIRSHTKPNGWNAIGMFTREELDRRQEEDAYCLETRELKHIYRGWTILEYGESIAYSPRRARYLSFANLIARKHASR